MNISPLKQNMEEFDYAISKFIDRVRDFHNDFDSMPITASMLQTYLHQSLMFKRHSY